MNILVRLNPVCAAVETLKQSSEEEVQNSFVFKMLKFLLIWEILRKFNPIFETFHLKRAVIEETARHQYQNGLTGWWGQNQLTGVDAGAGRRNAKLWLNELWDEGDESGYYCALCRVGQADEQEGHVAEDPHCCFGQIWKRKRKKKVSIRCKEVPDSPLSTNITKVSSGGSIGKYRIIYSTEHRC